MLKLLERRVRWVGSGGCLRLFTRSIFPPTHALATVIVLVCGWGAAPSLASGYPTPTLDLPLSPLPPGLNSLMPVPMDNPLTWEKIDLGRRLFFDTRLSRDLTVSCATCHLPAKAFTDGKSLPTGIDNRSGRRNVPSLVNSAYARSMFWDGRTASLEEQALSPITSPVEMDYTLEAVVSMLETDSGYREMFREAFGAGPIKANHIAHALASFQRTLVAANSPYDQFELTKDTSFLSEPARRGMKLFRGKARCAHCHEGPLFTNQKFHNTGVSWGKEPLDLGRFEHTAKEEDQGRFKTPTLRNLMFTAPYMHDGSLASLEDVIEFYNRGGHPGPYLDGTIRALDLTQQEKSDLIEFLASLNSVRPSEFRRFTGPNHDAN